MTTVTVQVTDMARPALERLKARLKDPATLAVLIPEMRAYLQDEFATEGAEGGSRWAPLSEATMRRKERKGESLRPLELTGDLMRSLTEAGAPSGYAETGTEGGDNYVEVGTRLPYAKFLVLGTRRMPARDPIGEPSPARVERWFELVAAELLK